MRQEPLVEASAEGAAGLAAEATVTVVARDAVAPRAVVTVAAAVAVAAAEEPTATEMAFARLCYRGIHQMSARGQGPQSKCNGTQALSLIHI